MATERGVKRYACYVSKGRGPGMAGDKALRFAAVSLLAAIITTLASAAVPELAQGTVGPSLALGAGLLGASLFGWALVAQGDEAAIETQGRSTSTWAAIALVVLGACAALLALSEYLSASDARWLERLVPK